MVARTDDGHRAATLHILKRRLAGAGVWVRMHISESQAALPLPLDLDLDCRSEAWGKLPN